MLLPSAPTLGWMVEEKAIEPHIPVFDKSGGYIGQPVSRRAGISFCFGGENGDVFKNLNQDTRADISVRYEQLLRSHRFSPSTGLSDHIRRKASLDEEHPQRNATGNFSPRSVDLYSRSQRCSTDILSNHITQHVRLFFMNCISGPAGEFVHLPPVPLSLCPVRSLGRSEALSGLSYWTIKPQFIGCLKSQSANNGRTTTASFRKHC